MQGICTHQEKLLGLRDGALVPYTDSEECERLLNAEAGKPTGVKSDEELSETVFGHCSLSRLLDDDRLSEFVKCGDMQTRQITLAQVARPISLSGGQEMVNGKMHTDWQKRGWGWEAEDPFQDPSKDPWQTPDKGKAKGKQKGTHNILAKALSKGDKGAKTSSWKPAESAKGVDKVVTEAVITLENGLEATLKVYESEALSSAVRRFLKEQSLEEWYQTPLSAWLQEASNGQENIFLQLTGDLRTIVTPKPSSVPTDFNQNSLHWWLRFSPPRNDMPKRRTDFATRFLLRCFACWAVPLLFVVLLIAAHPDDTGQTSWYEDDAALLVMAGLALMSLLGVTAHCSLDAGAACLLMNMVMQLLMVFTFLNGAPLLPPASPALAAAPASPALRGVERGAGAKGQGRISVVLPCLNETHFAVQTVQSFCNRTPSEVLQEIIVVDDGSKPPLSIELQKRVDPRCRLRVLRHEDGPRGLMIAKQTGGDAATGEFIGFYDCHVAPRKGWHAETIQLLQAKSRRLVIPMIGALNIDTWDEIPGGGFVGKCWVNFNADWWWYDDESDYTPVISGGLVATTRSWWQESGGFDPGMHGWGGENTEQPIRTWLCGGDVLRAKSSVVAHMWRTEADKRTIARYKIRERYDNVARTAAAWFDEFLPKFRSGQTPNVDVTKTLELKKRLECKPFAYFLHRFRKIYLKSGMLPEKVFRIRSRSTNMCLQRRDRAYVLTDCSGGTWFHRANMIPPGFPQAESLSRLVAPRPSSPNRLVSCGGHQAMGGCDACPQGHGSEWCNADCKWVFAVCLSHQEAAKVATEPAETCCSGIREWNSLDCWAGLTGKGPETALCDVTGHSTSQQFIFDADGHIWHGTGECLGVKDGGLKKGQCATAEQWDMLEAFEPFETKTYKAAVVKSEPQNEPRRGRPRIDRAQVKM
ncbi:unnamed protein product [Effrenium voratum]|nr:unnamed protein product [Effrenium voratum]